MYQEISLSCGLGSKLGRILHVGLIDNNDATCGDLFEDPQNTEEILDPKFHSNQMEVHQRGKTYEHSFFEPVDVAFENAFDLTFAECLAENNVKATDQSAFEMQYNCNCKGKQDCHIPILN